MSSFLKPFPSTSTLGFDSFISRSECPRANVRVMLRWVPAHPTLLRHRHAQRTAFSFNHLVLGIILLRCTQNPLTHFFINFSLSHRLSLSSCLSFSLSLPVSLSLSLWLRNSVSSCPYLSLACSISFTILLTIQGVLRGLYGERKLKGRWGRERTDNSKSTGSLSTGSDASLRKVMSFDLSSSLLLASQPFFTSKCYSSLTLSCSPLLFYPLCKSLSILFSQIVCFLFCSASLHLSVSHSLFLLLCFVMKYHILWFCLECLTQSGVPRWLQIVHFEKTIRDLERVPFSILVSAFLWILLIVWVGWKVCVRVF